MLLMYATIGLARTRPIRCLSSHAFRSFLVRVKIIAYIAMPEKRPRQRARLTIEQIEHALRQANGNVSHAARELGVTRWALGQRISRSEHLKQVVTEAREEMVDIAETALRKQIEQGNIAAIIFALKTIGRPRGYVERTEHEVGGFQGGPIILRWADDDTEP